ncbi:(d)CMP kinase [bacterium]|nr:(d)CMP kinase [bacterium]
MTASNSNAPKQNCRIVAIDGPAGSGKSTTAKLVAARLGYQYLDTGAMYRALTWHALQNGIAPSDEPTLARIAAELTIDFETHADANRVFLNGIEVTNEIRTPEVTRHVSEVSAHHGVRVAMVEKQKAMGKKGCIVAEGRDTTTVVFPQADLKIYLIAAVDERAKRRLEDLRKLGVSSSIGEQVADLERRDHFDSNRQHSPLTRAKDAFEIDTTSLTIEQQVDRIIGLLS